MAGGMASILYKPPLAEPDRPSIALPADRAALIADYYGEDIPLIRPTGSAALRLELDVHGNGAVVRVQGDSLLVVGDRQAGRRVDVGNRLRTLRDEQALGAAA